MTADPYPTNLDELDVEPINPSREAVANRLIATLNRLAQAVEQNTLALLDRPQDGPNPQNAHQPFLSTLPPVQGVPVAQGVVPGTNGVPLQPAGVCPVHNQPWNKLVPAGNRKSDGKAYNAFWACPTSGCDQRSPR